MITSRTFRLIIALIALAFLPAPDADAQSPRRQDSFDSIEVSDDHQVTFRIRAPKAEEVTVGGDFGPGGSMKKDDQGVWSITVGPLVPDFYSYRFVVDGVVTVDPKNPMIKPGISRVDSMFLVPGDEAEFELTQAVPHGELRAVWYGSKTLGVPRRMHVYTPPGYESGTDKYPVFYLLHGGGDDDAGWSTIGRAGFILDNLIAAKKALPMIVVMPNGSLPRPENLPSRPAAGEPPSPEYLAARRELQNRFTDELLQEVVPAVEQTYRVKGGPENRALAGLSMGGGQTLRVLATHPDQFAHIGIWSAGLFGGNAEEWAKQNEDFLASAAVVNGAVKSLEIVVGDQDFALDGSKALSEVLKSHDINHELRITGGGHTWINWRHYLHDLAPRLFVDRPSTTTSADSAVDQVEQPGKRLQPSPRIRYELGSDSKPQEGVPQGKLEGPFLFHSKIIEDTVRKYWIYVPAQYTGDEPACVLVFQDGARAINPNGVLRVPQVLDNLIAKKQIPVTIGIFITPGQRGDEFPDSIGTGNPNNRAREYDVLDDTYARFLIEEMLPEVGKNYVLTKDPGGRAIGGASSGGICAFTVAWERPDEFRNVVSLIGSFTDIHGGHVYPQLVRESDRKPIRIFLQDGVDDLRNPTNLSRDWHVQNQAMVAAFKEKDYDMAYVFGEGGHSDDHGGAILPQMLRWIWRDYPGVEQPTSDLVAEAEAVKPIRQELFPGFDANASVDPSGVWTWEQRFGRRTSTNRLELTSTDGQLAGMLQGHREGADQPAAPVAIEAPELVGNKLIFDVTREFNGRSFTTTYHGIVREGTITGWGVTQSNGTQRDSEWKAARVASE